LVGTIGTYYHGLRFVLSGVHSLSRVLASLRVSELKNLGLSGAQLIDSAQENKKDQRQERLREIEAFQQPITAQSQWSWGTREDLLSVHYFYLYIILFPTDVTTCESIVLYTVMRYAVQQLCSCMQKGYGVKLRCFTAEAISKLALTPSYAYFGGRSVRIRFHDVTHDTGNYVN
jgi:hypothetical protein